MKCIKYRTGTILRDYNDYYLVLGIFKEVVEETKREIANYDLFAIGREINWVLYDKHLCLLALDDENIDFTKEINESFVFPATFSYLKNCQIVKNVKTPENFLLKIQMLYPKLRGLMTVGEGVKELQKELDSNKYRKAVEKIKKKSTFQRIKRVKNNQIVAAKLTDRYRIFLVEDTRVVEFSFPNRNYKITNLANIDLSKLKRTETQLVNAKEYYLLANLKG